MQQLLRILMDLIDRIEANLASEINIAELAGASGISPFHFQRLFKAVVGDSLGRYIRGRRLTRAAELLLETEDGILDVALAVGFNSHEAFTRSFKEYFHATPKEFRKEKPRVILAKKPLLTLELFDHIRSEMDLEPRIVDLDRRTIVGVRRPVLSPFVLEDRFCDEVDETWLALAARLGEIPDAVPGAFSGITISASGDFTEEHVEYLAGRQVTRASRVPEGMVQYTLPAGKYALFEQRVIREGRFKQTVDYVYGYWLPNSKYTRGRGDDYVLIEGMLEFGKPGAVSYALPIEPLKAR